MSELILSKPGPLTPEELQKIRAHPKAGADIVSSVAFPYPVADLIMSHHERWDGKGYPAGLKAEQIPLGARILSVVDSFDALMTERPYHEAVSADDAIVLLHQEAGKGLDPTVVGTFIELLPALRQQEALAAGEHVRPELTTKKIFDEIALVHRDTAALYDLARAMSTTLGVSDTMALISARLMNLVPFECVALFLHDEETGTLRCRVATGIDADVIHQVAVPIGEGLTGWVARNRRPLVNARPSADLEAAGLTQLSTTLQSALACPLLFNARLVGTLSVYHTDATFYHDDHRRLLDHVCEQAAAAISNSILFELTQEDALTDPVTGLANTFSCPCTLRASLPGLSVGRPNLPSWSWISKTSEVSIECTGTTPEIERSATSPGFCAPRSVRAISPSGTVEVNSSSSCPAAGRTRRSRNDWS